MATQLQSTSYRKPKALIFDVFGTVVSWRETISSALSTACARELSLTPPSVTGGAPLPPLEQHDIAKRSSALKAAKELKDGFWDRFAQEWRGSYGAFVHSFGAGNRPLSRGERQADQPTTAPASLNSEELSWISVDSLHYSALVTLLHHYNLSGLFSASVLRDLTLAWHTLPGHPDSASGVRALKEQAGILHTSSLSNANCGLLADLARSSGVPFDAWFGADDFYAYKPESATYLGACSRLGYAPEDVGMVAAHMSDCLAARSFGLTTFYVQREGEETWGADEVRQIARDGGVQEAVWIGEGGFEELARRLASK